MRFSPEERESAESALDHIYFHETTPFSPAPGTGEGGPGSGPGGRDSANSGLIQGQQMQQVGALYALDAWMLVCLSDFYIIR